MATYRALKTGMKRTLSDDIDGTFGAIVTDADSEDEDLNLGEDMGGGIEEDFEDSDVYDSDDDIPLVRLAIRPRPNIEPRQSPNIRPNVTQYAQYAAMVPIQY